MSSNVVQVRAPKLALLITLALLGLEPNATAQHNQVVTSFSELWPSTLFKLHKGNKVVPHGGRTKVHKANKANKGCMQLPADPHSLADDATTTRLQLVVPPHLTIIDLAAQPVVAALDKEQQRTDSANMTDCEAALVDCSVSFGDMLCLLGLGGDESALADTVDPISTPIATVSASIDLDTTPSVPDLDTTTLPTTDGPPSPQACPCTVRHTLRLCSPRDADPTISKDFSRGNNIFAATAAFIESHGGLPAELPGAFQHQDVFPLVRTQPNTYTPESVVMSWPNGFDRATGVCMTRYHAEGRYIDAANELYRKLNSREPGYTPECLPVIPHIDEVTPVMVLNGFALWLQLATLSASTVSPAVAWRVCQLVVDAQRQRKQSRTISRSLRLTDIVPRPPRCETALAPHCTACGKREVAHDHLGATGRDLLEFIGHAEALELGAALASPMPVALPAPSTPLVSAVLAEPDACARSSESTPSRSAMGKIGKWWNRACGAGV